MINLKNLDSVIYEGLASLGSETKNECYFCQTDKIHFHASDFGACGRKLLYNLRTKEQKKFDQLTASFLLDGHFSEQFLVAGIRRYLALNKIENLELSQNPSGFLEYGVIVSGNCDLLITDNTDGCKYIVEFKAVKPYSFNTKFVNKDIGSVYYGQVQAYIHIFGAEYGVIIAKNRENSELSKPIVLDKDTSYYEHRIAVLKDVIDCYNNGVNYLERKANKNDSECKFCDYKKECWS